MTLNHVCWDIGRHLKFIVGFLLNLEKQTSQSYIKLHWCKSYDKSKRSLKFYSHVGAIVSEKNIFILCGSNLLEETTLFSPNTELSEEESCFVQRIMDLYANPFALEVTPQLP